MPAVGPVKPTWVGGLKDPVRAPVKPKPKAIHRPGSLGSFHVKLDPGPGSKYQTPDLKKYGC